MVKINLKKIYPIYQEDYIIEVTEELAEVLKELGKMEYARQQKINRHKAYYSLDYNNGFENFNASGNSSVEELYERKVMQKLLSKALSTLSEKESRRIFLHCVLGLSKAEIGRREGVSRDAVTKCIQSGLKKMKIYLEKFEI